MDPPIETDKRKIYSQTKKKSTLATHGKTQTTRLRGGCQPEGISLRIEKGEMPFNWYVVMLLSITLDNYNHI